MDDAGFFMGNKIRELAQQHPELCDSSGKGFWPVPAFFPFLLSHSINRLQSEITHYTLQREIDKAAILTQVRLALLKIVFRGDLGEDHTGIFLYDHKKILDLKDEEYQNLPFYSFCEKVLRIQNPIVLLGILTRNEEGSLEEAKALAQTQLIAAGEFARIHLIEEEEHGRLSGQIRQELLKNETFKDDFSKGLEFHDIFYETITN